MVNYKKPWRRNVKTDKDHIYYRNEIVLNRYLFNTFSVINTLMHKGRFMYRLYWGNSVTVKYSNDEYENSINIIVKIETRRGKDEMIYLIQDFILLHFFEYERNGQPMKFVDMAKLMWVTNKATTKEVEALLTMMYDFMNSNKDISFRGIQHFTKYLLNHEEYE